MDVEEGEEEESRDVMQHVRKEGKVTTKRRDMCPADPSEGHQSCNSTPVVLTAIQVKREREGVGSELGRDR